MAEPNREALDRIQAGLAERKSIGHFAHAAVAIVWGLISAGAAGKMLWDLRVELIEFTRPIMVMATLLLLYGLVHWLLGRRELVKELEQFAKMRSMRAQLKLDDPSALLPR